MTGRVSRPQLYTKSTAPSASAEERIPKAVLRPSCIHRAPNFRRVGRLDLEEHKRWSVHMPDERSGLGNVRLLRDRTHCRDAGSRRDRCQVYAKRSVALLIARLPVMAIVDTDNRQVGRMHDRYRGERSNGHEKFPVTRHLEYPWGVCGRSHPTT